jgi:hypothetical protein
MNRAAAESAGQAGLLDTIMSSERQALEWMGVFGQDGCRPSAASVRVLYRLDPGLVQTDGSGPQGNRTEQAHYRTDA